MPEALLSVVFNSRAVQHSASLFSKLKVLL